MAKSKSKYKLKTHFDFPLEIKDIVATLLDENGCTADLKNLRLLSHSWKEAAERRLFRCVTVRPERLSAERFIALSKCEAVNRHTRHIIVETLCDLDRTRRSHFMNEAGDPVIRENWAGSVFDNFHFLDTICLSFPNLSAVNLKFSADNLGHDKEADIAIQPHSRRMLIMDKLLNALDERSHALDRKDVMRKARLSSISSLTLTNLLKFPICDTADDHEDVCRVRGGISSLSELNFSVRVKRNWVPEFSSLSKSQDMLKTKWLIPNTDNLTSLAVYMDTYWGAIPHLELDFQLPRLKRLKLGNYCFAYPSQLQWIVSHKSLEYVSLDDCPIVALIDPDDYLVESALSCGASPWIMRHYDSDGKEFYVNRSRWHHYFDLIKSNMTNLLDLRCGHGRWEDPERDSTDKTEYFRRAFEARDQLETKIHSTRYVVFVGRRPAGSNGAWYEVHDDHPVGDELPRRARNRLTRKITDPARIPELSHENRVKDEEALKSLSDVLRKRRARVSLENA